MFLPTARWPVQLVEKLRKQGVAIDDPRIVAVTGWTTDELSTGMDQANLAPGYDLVTLLIGVNNQYRGRSAGEYRSQFHVLLLRAVGLANHRPERVVVVSIPIGALLRSGMPAVEMQRKLRTNWTYSTPSPATRRSTQGPVS